MAHIKLLRNSFALALVVGTGVFASHGAYAADAGTFSELSACLASSETTCTTTAEITISDDTTLDLAGKTVATSGNYSLNVSGATLAISDSVGGGKISGKYPLVINSDGVVTMNSGEISSTSTTIQNYGAFTMNGGTLTSSSYGIGNYDGATTIINDGTLTTTYAAISGNNTLGDMNAYINGGTITTTGSVAVYMPTQGVLEITDGSIAGGIFLRMGQVKISGGTISRSGGGLITSSSQYYTYSGMIPYASALTVLGGTYASSSTTYGNSLNLEITGGTFTASKASAPAVAVYDAGKVAQTINVTATGGVFTPGSGGEAIVTQTLQEAGYTTLVSGYGAITNTINAQISGGQYATAPAAEDIIAGYEAEQVGDTYVILPTTIDLQQNGLMASDDTLIGAIGGSATFTSEFIADRKAHFEIATLDDNEAETLVLTSTGEIILPFDASLYDRDGNIISVSNTSITIRVNLTSEQYATLSAYDSVKVVYFNNDTETERIDAEIQGDASSGYYVEFTTSHFSTYAIVGINSATTVTSTTSDATNGETTANTKAPNTGAASNLGDNSATAKNLLSVNLVNILALIAVGLSINKRLNRNKNR